MSISLLILYPLTYKEDCDVITLLPDKLRDIPLSNINIIYLKESDFDIYIQLWEHYYLEPLKYIAIYRSFSFKLYNHTYITFYNWLKQFCNENSLDLYFL